MIPNGFHGYSVHLGAQLIGTAAAIVYGLTAAIIVFTVIDRVIGLRVTESEEFSGLDIAAHGMAQFRQAFRVPAGGRCSRVVFDS